MASHYIQPREIWDLFMGIFANNEYAAAGAMGNMQEESGFYSDNAENAWNRKFGLTDEWLTENINNGTITLTQFLQRSWWVNDYGFGYGLSQWTDTTRRTMLWDYTIDSGADIDDKQAQFSYIEWEWLSQDSYYSQFTAYMRNATSVEDACRYYCAHYEVGSWNSRRLTYANNWYNTFATQGGNNIYVQPTGNGTAYVDVQHPIDGQNFTLYAYPNSGEELLDITAQDAHGQWVALSLTTVQTLPYDETNWGNRLTIYVEFSGVTPPPPPPPPPYREKKKMPIWMYPCLRYLC